MGKLNRNDKAKVLVMVVIELSVQGLVPYPVETNKKGERYAREKTGEHKDLGKVNDEYDYDYGMVETAIP
ncbi:hypothetical protein FQA39_LY07585 [Lamprigera yunnana]|nr:hypothetical protein FQA39_LY07585 [Lamprigera yunnana]